MVLGTLGHLRKGSQPAYDDWKLGLVLVDGGRRQRHVRRKTLHTLQMV